MNFGLVPASYLIYLFLINFIGCWRW